jgi:para-nitrobenzyl esterase
LPWSQLLAAQTSVGAQAFAPIVDGRHIPANPPDEAVASWSDSVPLIISTTLDDAGLFFDRFAMTESELIETLTASYGARAAALAVAYRGLFPAKPPYLRYSQIITDAGFRRFAHAQAEAKAGRSGAAVFTYLWEWACPAYNGKFGAVHAMDVAASLRNERDAILGSGSTDARRMCETLGSAFLAFAKTGDPNTEQIPHWPRFDASLRSTMVFDLDTRVVRDPHGALRNLWLDMPPAASVLG